MREKRMGHTLGRRTAAAVLALCMLLTMTPAVAAADGVRTLTGFAALGDEVREQIVPHGTAREDLTLPGTLEATALVPAPAEPEEDKPMEEPPAQESEPPADPDPEQVIEDAEPPLSAAPDTQTVSVSGVTWESTPAYDGEAAGAYVFTAVLPGGYEPAADVSLPQITVTVAEPEAMPMTDMARNVSAVTVDNKDIYANGLPIVITKGATDDLTVICGEDGQPLTIEGLANNANGGTDLKTYTVYGGAKGSNVASASITMEGGKVRYLYGGGHNGSVSGAAVLTMTSGSVESTIYGDSCNSGTVHSSRITITGGRVAIGSNGSVRAASMATSSAELTITGGFISGFIMGNTRGSNAKPTLTVGGTAVIGDYSFAGIQPKGFQSVTIAPGGFTGAAGVAVEVPANFSGQLATNATAGDEKYFILFGAGATGNAAVVQNGGIELAAAALNKDAEGRYEISSEANLRFMRDQVNAKNADYPSASYIQTADLNLSGFNWFPIGGKYNGGNDITYSNVAPFSGHYDGGGHTITGMTAFWPQLYAVGLFGLHDPRVQNKFSNLTLESCSVIGFSFVGALLGGGEKYSPPNGPQISNCHVSGESTVTAAAKCVGGLVGGADRAALTGCTASADISGILYCGGLAGRLGNSLGASDCHATGDVTVVRQGSSAYNGNQIGGLMGSISALNSDATMTNCSATGNVSARTDNQIPNPNLSSWISMVGGLCGQVNKIKVSNCFATGSVSGEREVGGLAGYATGYGTPSSIEGCYATGDVSGSICEVGGLVGDADSNTAITSSHASGEVSSAGYSVGGLVGYMSGSVQTSWASGGVAGAYNVGGLLGNGADATAKHCYALGDVTGTDWNVGGVVGYGENGTVENCFATGAVQSRYYKAGGIAGTGGTIKNCAALNPSVTSSGSNPTYKPTVGRVCGDASADVSATLENNFAFDGMTLTVDSSPVTPISGAADNLHGADGSVGLCQSADSYPESAGWTAANGWIVTDGGNEYLALALAGFGAVTTPEHLRYTLLDIVYLGGAGRDDAHDGSSPENAVATANKAVELAADSGTIVVCGDTKAGKKLNIEGKSLIFTNTDGVTEYPNPILTMNRPFFATDVTLRGVTWKQEGGNPYCTVGKNATLTLDTVTPVNIQYIQGDIGARLLVKNSTLSGVVGMLLAFDHIELDHSSATAMQELTYPPFLNDASDIVLKNGSTLFVGKNINSLTSVGLGNTLQASRCSTDPKPVPVPVVGPIMVDEGMPLTLSSYWKTADGRPFLLSEGASLTPDKFTLDGDGFVLVKQGDTIYAASTAVSTLAPQGITQTEADLHGAAATQFPLDGTEFFWWKSGDEGAKQSLVTTANNGDNTFSAALSELDADTLYYFRAVATVGGMRCEGNTLSFRTKPEATPTGSIEGSVVNNTGAQCGITVTIEEGNTVRATQVLSNVADNASSSFSFSALPDGFYNVVADNGAYKVTRLVEIKGGTTSTTVVLALGKTQSVVEIVTPDTPPAAVNGLPEQFGEKARNEDEGYTDANERVVQNGGTVELKLAVERKEEDLVSTDDVELITKAAAGQTIPIYLDLSVIKTVIPTVGSTTTTPLISVPKLLTVVLPLPDEAVGKQNITVYRVHSGAAAALPKTDPGGDGEWAETSGENAIFHIRQFSTYAVGYDIPTSGGSVTTYKITATAGEGGSISPSGKVRVNHGGKKTFTITPEEGYEIADVLVDGKSAGAVSGYAFESVKAGHTITASFQKSDNRAVWNPFEDVHEDDWFHDSVKYAYENSLMVGTSDTTFSPYLDTSRGMIITILWRMESGPNASKTATFPDVAADQYYSDAVAWGAENSIVKGYDNGNYGPTDPITREQLAAILWRYAKYKGMDVSVGENTNILSCPDFAQISEYAIPALQWAAGAGILNGKGGGCLDPKGTATRAETVTMLERFLNNIKQNIS